MLRGAGADKATVGLFKMAPRSASVVKVPVGANATNYRRGAKSERQARIDAQTRAFQALPADEKARRVQDSRDYQADMAAWRKEFDDPNIGPEEASLRLQKRRASRRALDGQDDREARIAVEGDTALDHLPFGESE